MPSSSLYIEERVMASQHLTFTRNVTRYRRLWRSRAKMGVYSADTPSSPGTSRTGSSAIGALIRNAIQLFHVLEIQHWKYNLNTAWSRAWSSAPSQSWTQSLQSWRRGILQHVRGHSPFFFTDGSHERHSVVPCWFFFWVEPVTKVINFSTPCGQFPPCNDGFISRCKS